MLARLLRALSLKRHKPFEDTRHGFSDGDIYLAAEVRRALHGDDDPLGKSPGWVGEVGHGTPDMRKGQQRVG